VHIDNSVQCEQRFSTLNTFSMRMKRYKQEELHQENEKLYQMLKSAPMTYTQRDFSEHSDKFYRMKDIINNNHRRRHQHYVANRIVNQKEHSLGMAHRQSMTLLQSQRMSRLHTSPGS
jgi:hypothetical protein